MPIYTKRGDKGQTDLFSGERVSKTDPRIEAYGTVDELNTELGLAESFLTAEETSLTDLVLELQNQLHIICANLANTNPEADRPEVRDADIEELETRIDELQEDLPDLRAFILPGGSPPGAQLHHARAVCRRAERQVLSAAETEGVDIGELNVKYLNRLSDLLFVMARHVNHHRGETERHPSYE